MKVSNIYLENFKLPIKVTNCGHSFCEECILVACPEASGWRCPICNQIHNHPARDLTRNFLVEQIMSSSQVQQSLPSSYSTGSNNGSCSTTSPSSSTTTYGTSYRLRNSGVSTDVSKYTSSLSDRNSVIKTLE